ncbi:MAG: AsmA family protein, partial [Aquincola sp.]|nr:AsmA family protein [Aquincola sp.]
RLAVRLSKVKLSERAKPDEFAAVDELSLAVEILPLLRKQLVIDRVSARGVRAVYSRDARGTSNIDDLMGAGDAGPQPKPGSRPQPTGAAVRFDVSAVQLDDVRLRLRDAASKLEGEVQVRSLKTGRLAHMSQAPVTLAVSVKLTQPQPMDLTLDGSTTLALDLDKNAVAARDMKLDARIDGAGFKGLALGFEGALAWDGAAVRAQALKLAVKGGSRGALTLSPSTLDVKTLLFSTTGQKLELEALRLALAGKQGADLPFEVSLDWPRLAVDAQSLKGSALAGQVKLGGATALNGKFQSAAPSGKFDALRLPGMALTLQGQMQQRKVNGTLKGDVLLNASRGAVSLDGLDLRATLTDAGLQPLQLAVRGSGAADAKSASCKLEGTLNTNRFDVAAQAALGGAVPTVKATARFDSLDVNKLLAPAAPAPGGAAPADSPVLLDGLNVVNGQFNVSAGSFVFRQYRVSDVKIDATLDSGLLRIQRLAGRAWGGAVEASGSAEAKSKRIAVKLAADGVDANALLKDVAGKDLLEGTGRVNADVSTTGATIGALRSNLAGTTALVLRNGAVKGFNLARSLRQAKAALSMKQDAVTQARATEKTDFSELTASARIAAGVAQSDDLDVKSPYLRIGGAGRFDIGRGTMDYTARATVVDTSKGQEGADLAALKGVTVPVQLSGPFDAINWKIQWSGVAAAALQAQVKEKLGAKLGLGAPKADAAASQPQQDPKALLRDKLKKLLK